MIAIGQDRLRDYSLMALHIGRVPVLCAGGEGVPANDFYTLRGYDRLDGSGISYAMEDYLEMICRRMAQGEIIRVGHLAKLLNVTPPSASKMVVKLREAGLVDAEPYGIIRLTDRGEALGTYLLHRHAALDSFFCMVNGTGSELELVEKIEHFIDERTVQNMEKILGRLSC